MKRRKFLQHTASAASIPVLLNGTSLRAMGQNTMFQQLLQSAEASDRVLVLIQQNGGNDGLNTVIPLDQYERLIPVRSDIFIPEGNTLKLTDETALHPSMTGLHSLYNEQLVGVVQGAGYPNPNFSHFRATDIWETASDSDEIVTSGWLGRYFDRIHPGYPTDYPNSDFPDPIAITIGSIVSNTCQGSVSNFGMALRNPDAFTDLLEGEIGDFPDTPYGHELKFLRQSMRQTNQYVEVIQQAAQQGANFSSLWPESGQNRLADELKIVAQLIAGGLKTKIYVVNLGGFDTHANQVVAGNPLQGQHATLLGNLSEAIVAFQDDIDKSGNADRVVGMTFSEFGRRIMANGSFGTDHGAAAPMFVFGTSVNPVIHGVNPIIPEVVEVKDSLPMQHDFRNIYGSILVDWFGLSEDDIKDFLFPDYSYLPVLQKASVGIEDEVDSLFTLHQNYPNPFRDQTRIKFESDGGWVQIKVYNRLGQEIQTVADRHFVAGKHELMLEGHSLSPGHYFLRMQHRNQQAMKTMVKM